MFSETAKNVMKARQNFGAPESMKLYDGVKTIEMYNKVITITEIVVKNDVKKDKETKEIIKTKTGEDIYQPYVYVAFDGNKFFVTKSAILVAQLESLVKKTLAVREKKDFTINDFNGKKVKVVTEKVKYKDGKDYDQVIFADAE